MFQWIECNNNGGHSICHDFRLGKWDRPKLICKSSMVQYSRFLVRTRVSDLIIKTSNKQRYQQIIPIMTLTMLTENTIRLRAVMNTKLKCKCFSLHHHCFLTYIQVSGYVNL